MPVKAYNPTTPARRGMTSQDLSDITTRKPLKSLIKAKKAKMPVATTKGRNYCSSSRRRRSSSLPLGEPQFASRLDLDD